MKAPRSHSDTNLFSLFLLLLSVLADRPHKNAPSPAVAAHSTSPIHLQPVRAQREHFVIGNGGSSPSCHVPSLQPSKCFLGRSIAFDTDGDVSLRVLALPWFGLAWLASPLLPALFSAPFHLTPQSYPLAPPHNAAGLSWQISANVQSGNRERV